MSFGVVERNPCCPQTTSVMSLNSLGIEVKIIIRESEIADLSGIERLLMSSMDRITCVHSGCSRKQCSLLRTDSLSYRTVSFVFILGQDSSTRNIFMRDDADRR